MILSTHLAKVRRMVVNRLFERKCMQKGDNLTWHCGLSKSVTEEGCKICTSNITAMIKSSVESGRVTDALRCFSNS